MNSAEALASGQDFTVKPDGDCELEGVRLAGLPEGILAVAVRVPEPGEMIYYGETYRHDVLNIFGPQLIVKAAPGYRFAYKINHNCYAIERLYDAPKRITAHFIAETDNDEARILGLKDLPGFDRFSFKD